MAREPIAIGLLVCFAMAAGCLEPREQAPRRHRDNCTTCHGSPVRSGTDLSRSAPPVALDGSTDPRHPGVGAHLRHVGANDLHGGVPCESCHVVPETTDAPGHADTALPAEVILSGIAAADGHRPSYGAPHLCADTYCHGGKTIDWRPTPVATPRCERCHAMPPAAPHPAEDECSLCHGEVVDAAGTIIAPSRHVDGAVDVEERCDTCHGAGELGAPPPSLSGATEPDALGVGAHTVHLEGKGTARRLACGECHLVPETIGAPGHLDGMLPAEVSMTGVATTEGRTATWDRDAQRCVDSWCHGAASPRWTETLDGCTSCHGMPPAAPHPQMEDCALCHGAVVDAARTIIAPSAHVDGTVDVDLPMACNACHGDATSPAPPVDLEGNQATTAPGVGAHRSHLAGSAIARPVPCEECHRVPATVLELGHVDTAGPAEVRFDGVARAFGASPSYDGATCADTYCHGGSFPFGHPSGAANPTPSWTDVQPGSLPCNACHGLPPPPPHPASPVFCSDCHPNVGVLLDILDPLTHVNGTVDLLP